MLNEKWHKLSAGTGCPFEFPRPQSNEQWDFIAKLSVSSLYLSKNQTYGGHCILILDLRHATTPGQLSSDEWAAFCADLHASERAISRVVRPDHMNVASLGNVVPHLHWHIVPRYVADPRWGTAIWLTNLADMADVRISAEATLRLVTDIQNALAPEVATNQNG